MNYERSCGAVVYRTENGKRQYLVIFNKKGSAEGHWGFPKGHVEPGESDLDTAKREIKEETGLSVRFEPFFKRVSHYSPRPETEKDSVYFAARALDGEVTIQQSELAGYEWLEAEDAFRRITYKADARILEAADKFLDKMERITTVIFDMDGVITDSEIVHYRSLLKVLAEYGKAIDYDSYARFVGSTNEYMWNTIIAEQSLDADAEELTKKSFSYTDEEIAQNGHPPVKGAAELIKELFKRGYTLAVASSSPMTSIEKVTEYFGVRSCFEKLVTGEDVKNPKPAPDVFLKAALQLDKKPEECLVIEDSENGVNAAVAAGMMCIGLINPSSGRQDLSNADYKVGVGFYMSDL